MTTAATAFAASQTAWAKVYRNESKLAWLDACGKLGDRAIAFGNQLEGYRAEAEAATAAFTAACADLTTEQVVAIITEARA